MARGPGRNDPCPCGSGKKYKRCCLNRDRTLARSHQGIDPQEPTQSYTLIVETATGGMARRIPDASPLGTEVRPGTAAEIATADAAAVWGLPDFVFRAELHRLGSGVRELGDGIVVVGDLGLVVQVKCRETPSGDSAREESWARKKAAQALSQANGTIRLLRETRSTVLTSRRGRTVAVEGNSIEWTPVVVLDHPGLPAAEGVIPER